MQYIKASRGIMAIVDDEDFAELSKYKWHACKRGYIRRTLIIRGKKTSIPMHHLLIEVPVGMQVDHINRIKYDNRRSNLRLATATENQRNRNKPKSKGAGGVLSMYKGVSWRPDKQKWRARISLENGKSKQLGSFDSELEAAEAYNRAAMGIDSVYYIANRLNTGSVGASVSVSF